MQAVTSVGGLARAALVTALVSSNAISYLVHLYQSGALSSAGARAATAAVARSSAAALLGVPAGDVDKAAEGMALALQSSGVDGLLLSSPAAAADPYSTALVPFYGAPPPPGAPMRVITVDKFLGKLLEFLTTSHRALTTFAAGDVKTAPPPPPLALPPGQGSAAGAAAGATWVQVVTIIIAFVVAAALALALARAPGRRKTRANARADDAQRNINAALRASRPAGRRVNGVARNLDQARAAAAVTKEILSAAALAGNGGAGDGVQGLRLLLASANGRNGTSSATAKAPARANTNANARSSRNGASSAAAANTNANTNANTRSSRNGTSSAAANTNTNVNTRSSRRSSLDTLSSADGVLVEELLALVMNPGASALHVEKFERLDPEFLTLIMKELIKRVAAMLQDKTTAGGKASTLAKSLAGMVNAFAARLQSVAKHGVNKATVRDTLRTSLADKVVVAVVGSLSGVAKQVFIKEIQSADVTQGIRERLDRNGNRNGNAATRNAGPKTPDDAYDALARAVFTGWGPTTPAAAELADNLKIALRVADDPRYPEDKSWLLGAAGHIYGAVAPDEQGRILAKLAPDERLRLLASLPPSRPVPAPRAPGASAHLLSHRNKPRLPDMLGPNVSDRAVMSLVRAAGPSAVARRTARLVSRVDSAILPDEAVMPWAHKALGLVCSGMTGARRARLVVELATRGVPGHLIAAACGGPPVRRRQ